MRRKNPLLEVVDILVEPALRAEVERLRAALERIADMRDRDGSAIEMHRDEIRDIARAALAGGDRFPCHMEREHYFRCKRPCGHPRCEIEKP